MIVLCGYSGYSAVSYPLVKYVPDLDKSASTVSEITTASSLSVKDIEGNGASLYFVATIGSAHGSLNGKS